MGLCQTHINPHSQRPVIGIRLQPGAVLRPDDVYDSTSGGWERCPIVGAILKPNAGATWVRPGELSKDASELLMRLARRPQGNFDCLAHKPSDCRGYLQVPDPDYDWDPRIGLSAVAHPECIQLLVDLGYLSVMERAYGITMYPLTPLGREAGQRLLRGEAA